MKNADRALIAKTLSAIESRDFKKLKSLEKFFSIESFKRSLCFTGPGGVGKSSLISYLLHSLAESQRSVAWLACDPSSSKTGGSVLGDRIRLDGTELSSHCFVRSMATRSSQAYSPAVRDSVIYLESKFDEVWVETAGSGQTENEIATLAGLTILILQPETGDEIQWLKSGLREWADLFVVHKSDLKGSDQMAKTLVELGANPERVVLVSSRERQGAKEFWAALDQVKKSTLKKSHLQKLHQAHGLSLFQERALKKASQEFSRAWERAKQNPYKLLKA